MSYEQKLAAGGFPGPNEANAELKLKNQSVVKTAEQRNLWLPWFTAWKLRADTLAKTGLMTTSDHYVQAFRETAIGLRSVRAVTSSRKDSMSIQERIRWWEQNHPELAYK